MEIEFRARQKVVYMHCVILRREMSCAQEEVTTWQEDRANMHVIHVSAT